MKKTGKYVFGIGLLVIVVGFLYEIMFAGIPPQDPPIDLQIRYDRDHKIASWIMNSGLIVTAVGVLISIAAKLSHRLRKKI
jgi:hypothetical protein